jgi:hypothetical protein
MGCLESLRPYVEYFENSTVEDMVEFCRSADHWEWAVQHLRPEVRRRAEAAAAETVAGSPSAARRTPGWFPTDDEVLAELDRIETEHPGQRRGHVPRLQSTLRDGKGVATSQGPTSTLSVIIEVCAFQDIRECGIR